MGVLWRLATLAAGAVVGSQVATEFVGWNFGWPGVFGPSLRLAPDLALYWPWSVFEWRAEFGDQQPRTFALAGALVMAGVLAGALAGQAGSRGAGKPERIRGWGDHREARRARLLDRAGCVVGEMHGRLITTTDLRPTLVTGGTRSGKGRGHVVPSLLSWTGSVLVHDPKGELWRITGGWRSGFSHSLRFTPRDPASARFNPLAEIRPGPQEVAQVQRLVFILADRAGPRTTKRYGTRRHRRFSKP